MQFNNPASTRNMTTPHLRKSISRSPLRRGFLLVALALGCFGLYPIAEGQLPSPAPDGGYPGGNTAEGDGALTSLTGGTYNTAIGFEALRSNTSGLENTAVGYQALWDNTTGGNNTATGLGALGSNTTGSGNTANGGATLGSNTTGTANTATGVFALNRNATGNWNTANGVYALFSNTGNDNTATGYQALFSSTGNDNTATGYQALVNNTTASNNTANGFSALFSNTTGKNNAAMGGKALYNNTTGWNNTANGVLTLYHNTVGTDNTAMGCNALFKTNTGTFNTAYGDSALYGNTTGSFNTAVGFNAGSKLTTGSSNVDIATAGVAGESNTIRIGAAGIHTNTFIAGINGVTVAGGVGVVIDTNGHLGTVVSSARFKEAIQPMDTASEAILALKPVTFRYKHELDPDGIPQFGLVAEEVEKVNPDLVVRGEDGKVTTVRYEAVNTMLLNEFLKEHQRAVEDHRKVEEQQATIARMKKQIDSLTAGLQKVSDQMELAKPASQTIATNQ
jgi:hypothetical protein